MSIRVFEKLSVMLTLSVLLILASCSEKKAEIGLLPCLTDSLQPAFVKADGEIIPFGLKVGEISAVVNGYFTAMEGAGLIVYKFNNGKPQPVNGLTGLKSAGYMAYGVMPVNRPGQHIEIVNGKGENVAVLEITEGEITECAPVFVDGFLTVTTDKGLQGLVNVKGEIVVNPVYSSIGEICDGKFIAMMDTAIGNEVRQRFAVVNTEGETVYAFPDDCAPVSQSIHDCKTVVRTQEGFAICDVKNNGAMIVLPKDISAVLDFVDGMIVYRTNNGVKGVIDCNGTEVVPAENRQIRIGPHGLIAVNDKNGWFIVDPEKGTRTQLNGFSMLSPVPAQAAESGYAFIGQTPEGYFIVDANGTKMNKAPLTKISYDKISVLPKVTSGYPVATTSVELPLDEDWE